MSHWEDHEFDPFLDEYPEPDDFSVTCKYCGQDGLAWVDLFGGWRLVDSDGDIHSCSRKSTAKQDFS